MKLTGLLGTAAAAALLGGCVIVNADGRDRDGHGYLYGVEVSAQNRDVTILVRSNGCTQKNHFRLAVDRRGEERYDIGFHRSEADNCRALVPEGRRLSWTFAELGIPEDARVMIVNQVGR